MFRNLNENELLEINASGPLIRALGYFCNAWMDYWEGVGEAYYDYFH